MFNKSESSREFISFEKKNFCIFTLFKRYKNMVFYYDIKFQKLNFK